MTEIGDVTDVVIEENIVLEKFEGDPADKNLVERVYLHNGEIVKRDFFENGVLVATEGGIENGSN